MSDKGKKVLTIEEMDAEIKEITGLTLSICS